MLQQHPRKRTAPTHKQMTRVGALAVACCTLGLALSASADSPADNLSQEWRGFFEERQINIQKTFDGGEGITGIITGSGQDLEVVYLLAGSDAITPGPLIASDGSSLSEQHELEHYLGDRLNGIRDTLEENDDLWIANGSDSADWVIYSFDDPNCPFCAAQHKELAPLVASGKLQVRHIPVAVLGASSSDLAAAALSSDDPAGNYAKYQSQFNDAGAKDALLAAGDPDNADALRILNYNLDLMDEAGITGTPGVILPPRKGEKHPRVARGYQTPQSLADHFNN